MQLLMGVPQLVEVVDSCSVWHDAAILACLINKLLCILGITAKLAPLPAFICSFSLLRDEFPHTCLPNGQLDRCL